MRNVPPFRCEGCGAESGYPSRCDACDQDYVDARGRPNVRPHVVRRRVPAVRGPMAIAAALGAFVTLQVLFVTWTGGTLRLDMFSAVAALAWVVFLGLGARWLAFRLGDGSRAARRGARAALAAVRATPIAEARDGRARVSGRVSVLSPATDEAADVAAALRRQRSTHTWTEEVSTRGGIRQVTRSETTITETAECGRFAVIDETGVAIVDDDAFRLWSRSGRGLPAARDGVLAARDGARVEIVGPARLGDAPEVTELSGALGPGYRAGPATRALLFDGTPDDPVWILVDP
ncbi:MAG: hypothetical protein KF729_28405 [Sandaracinaceae bacterium]|nr:hypothetical protein [Sandaracinaceae bacterium]